MKENQQHIPKKPIGFLIFASKPFKGVALGAMLGVIIAASLSQSTALFFKWIVEAVEQNNKEAALMYGLLYPVAIFGVQILYRVSGVLGMHWLINVKRYTADELFSYSLKHGHNFFSNRFAGSLLSKVTNVTGALDSLIHDILWSYLDTTVTLLVTLYFIFSIDVLSGFIFIGLIATLLVVNYSLRKTKQVYSRATAEAGSKLRGAIVDVYSNINAVRQFSAVKKEEKTVEELNEKWSIKGKRSWMYSEKTQLLNSVILFVFASAMFYVLVSRWRTEQISASDFIFILTLVSYLTGALTFIGRAMTTYARAIGEAEEGLEDILVPFEIEDEVDAKSLTVPEGKIEFASVGFKYEENDIFKDFNLTIKPGERIGLVGHSGAGKTTFVSLLLRQHDLTSGQIFIDEQDIKTVTQSTLRQAIAVVPQEPALFHRTIKENIAYGKPGATDEEIIEVAKKAQAHDFIMSLPLQYDTLVGERGIKLSGGQKQRIAIARAMIKDAPILVLDEATSALDSESEVAIQAALSELMKGKTVIAVAHRLSTLREMDRIIVLDNGRIIEDGPHNTLTTGGGIYQKLWEHQAGGFLTE